jgi:hypothetical protein
MFHNRLTSIQEIKFNTQIVPKVGSLFAHDQLWTSLYCGHKSELLVMEHYFMLTIDTTLMMYTTCTDQYDLHGLDIQWP